MATKKKSARPAKRAAKKVSSKKAAPKRAAKKPVKRTVKKTAKRPAKKAPARKSAVKKSGAKRPTKKAAAKSSNVETTRIVVPPVPTRSSAPVAPAPATPKPQVTQSAPAKKNSSSVLFLVIAGVVLLAIFALTNSSSDDDVAPVAPVAPVESVSEEPSAEPSESESATELTYEAPSGFVAINNGTGVTLRWKSPAATEGLTGYLISISYNTVDFIEVATVPADQFSLDVARTGDEGGTQFFIQSVYEDGTKADGAKFALKGKYE